jgi:hypothetical protein
MTFHQTVIVCPFCPVGTAWILALDLKKYSEIFDCLDDVTNDIHIVCIPVVCRSCRPQACRSVYAGAITPTGMTMNVSYFEFTKRYSYLITYISGSLKKLCVFPRVMSGIEEGSTMFVSCDFSRIEDVYPFGVTRYDHSEYSFNVCSFTEFYSVFGST